MNDYFIRVYELLHGTQTDPIYRDQIYPEATFALLALTLVGPFFFYLVLGAITARFVLVRHWVICLMVTSLVNAAVVMVLVERAADGRFDFSLGLVQGLYTAVLFLPISAGIKPFSPNVRRTPF